MIAPPCTTCGAPTLAFTAMVEIVPGTRIVRRVGWHCAACRAVTPLLLVSKVATDAEGVLLFAAPAAAGPVAKGG